MSARWWIRVGVCGFVAAVLWLFVGLASIQADLVELFWMVDPDTGMLVENVHSFDRYPAIHHLLEREYDALLLPTGAALGSMLLVLVGLWRSNWARRLPLIAALVALPLLIALGAGLLTSFWFDGELELIATGLGAQDLRHTGQCMPSLEACSRARALDSVFAVASVVISVGTVGLVLVAAPRLWRASKAGAQLGRGVRGAAIVLFGVGALALVLSSPHQRDRERVLESCAGAPGQVWTPSQHLPNPAPVELQAVSVSRCVAPRWTQTRDVGAYQLFETGVLAELAHGDVGSLEEQLDRALVDSHDLRERLTDDINRASQIAEHRGESVRFGIAIYADARTPTELLAGVLRMAQAAGVSEIQLLGEGAIAGELDTIGGWKQRVYCTLGTVRLDAEGWPLDGFASWAELAAAASARGLEPLEPLAIAL